MPQLITAKVLRSHPEALRPYVFHGATEFETPIEVEAKGFCPICRTRSKRSRVGALYINQEKGVWHCKHCNTGGNVTQFLRNLYRDRRQSTKDAQYESLVKVRLPITIDHAKQAGLAWDDYLDRWLIPYFSADGKFSSLRVWSPPRGKIYTTPGESQGLWNMQTLSNKGIVYLTEGEWDAIAFFNILPDNAAVVASPGASFQPRWASLFQGRNVVILFDNDRAGESAMQRAAFALRGTARTIRTIIWSPELPKGYDLRDFLASYDPESDPEAILEELHSTLEVPQTNFVVPSLNGAPPKPKRELPKTRPTFGTILKEIKAVYPFKDERIYDTLAVTYGTIWSNFIDGDPVWMFIVGPSGCGKTTFVSTARDAHVVKYQSSLSPASLVSGFNPKDGHDPSLIAQILGKTLIIKDFTEILEEPEQIRDRIIAILRGGFDGHIDRDYGNGISRSYEGYFSIVAAVTDKIHAIHRSDLGERFLKYQMLTTHRQQFAFRDQIRAAVKSAVGQRAADEYIRGLVQEYYNHTPTAIPPVSQWLVDKIIPLSDLVEAVRGRVVRSGPFIAHPPSGGVGTRVAKQLTKLAQGISIAWGKRAVPHSVYPILQKTALDTAFGWQSEIVLYLLSEGHKTLNEICEHLNMHRGTCEHHLQDLKFLGIIDRFAVEGGSVTSSGRPVEFAYTVVKEVRDLWRRITGGAKHK